MFPKHPQTIAINVCKSIEIPLIILSKFAGIVAKAIKMYVFVVF